MRFKEYFTERLRLNDCTRESNNSTKCWTVWIGTSTKHKILTIFYSTIRPIYSGNKTILVRQNHPIVFQIVYIALRTLHQCIVCARTTRQGKATMRNSMYARHRNVDFRQLCGIPCTFAIETHRNFNDVRSESNPSGKLVSSLPNRWLTIKHDKHTHRTITAAKKRNACYSRCVTAWNEPLTTGAQSRNDGQSFRHAVHFSQHPKVMNIGCATDLCAVGARARRGRRPTTNSARFA